MLSISIEHPDAEEFINAKLDLSKVTGANISVQVTDEFMRAVVEDKPFVQKFPVGSANPTMTKTISAKKLWDTLINNAWSSAEPGIIFGDRMKTYSPDAIYEKYRMICTNPCLIAETTLITKEGIVPIIDRIDKDTTIWNGYEWSDVRPFKTSDKAKVYTVKFSSGDELTCTSYHKFILKGNVRKPLSEVKVGDKLENFEYPIIHIDKSKAVDISDKEMYTLGFFCGDGTFDNRNKNKPRGIIDLYQGKLALAEFMDGHLVGNWNESQKRQRFVIDKNIKIKPNKSFVPDNNFTLQSKLAYLAGVIDSDGTKNDKGGSIGISSNDRQFLMDIKQMLTTMGVLSTVRLSKKANPHKNIKGKFYSTKSNYRLLLSSSNVMKLYNIGLRTHRVEITLKEKLFDNRLIKVESIEYKGEEPTYCLTDDKNHSCVFNNVMTGQCGEISLGAYDSCRLIHINFNSFVSKPFTEDAKFNYKLLYEVSYETQRLADDLVDLELEAIDRIIDVCKDDEFEKGLWKKMRDTGEKGRRTGVGFTALADAIASLNINYNSKEGIETVENIIATWSKALTDSTIDLAIERGSFPDFKGYFNHEDEFKNNVWYESLRKRDEWNYNRLLKFGSRNISWNTVNEAAA